jgi:hypothetical protein
MDRARRSTRYARVDRDHLLRRLGSFARIVMAAADAAA